MAVADFLSKIPVVGTALGGAARGDVGGFLRNIPIAGQIVSSAVSPGPGARAMLAAQAEALAGSQQERELQAEEARRVQNERISRAADAVAKRLSQSSNGVLSPEQSELVATTFGSMLKGDDAKAAFADALKTSGGDFEAASQIFGELPRASAAGGTGGGTTAALQVLDRIKAAREAQGNPMTVQEEAALAERLYRPLSFSEAGPGVYVQQNPTRGGISTVGAAGGGAPAQVAPVQGGLAAPPQIAQGAPGDLTSQVAAAEGLVAGAKEGATAAVKELQTIRDSVGPTRQLIAATQQALGLLESGVTTGPASALALPLQKFLVEQGIVRDEAALQNITTQQAFGALGNQFALQARNPNGPFGGLTGSTSNKDLTFLRDSVPGLAQTTEGNVLIGQMFLGKLQRDLDYATWYDSFSTTEGRRPSVEEQNKWVAAQPSIIPKSIRDMVKAQETTAEDGPAALKRFRDALGG